MMLASLPIPASTKEDKVVDWKEQINETDVPLVLLGVDSQPGWQGTKYGLFDRL